MLAKPIPDQSIDPRIALYFSQDKPANWSPVSVSLDAKGGQGVVLLINDTGKGPFYAKTYLDPTAISSGAINNEYILMRSYLDYLGYSPAQIDAYIWPPQTIQGKVYLFTKDTGMKSLLRQSLIARDASLKPGTTEYLPFPGAQPEAITIATVAELQTFEAVREANTQDYAYMIRLVTNGLVKWQEKNSSLIKDIAGQGHKFFTDFHPDNVLLKELSEDEALNILGNDVFKEMQTSSYNYIKGIMRLPNSGKFVQIMFFDLYPGCFCEDLEFTASDMAGFLNRDHYELIPAWVEKMPPIFRYPPELRIIPSFLFKEYGVGVNADADQLAAMFDLSQKINKFRKDSFAQLDWARTPSELAARFNELFILAFVFSLENQLTHPLAWSAAITTADRMSDPGLAVDPDTLRALENLHIFIDTTYTTKPISLRLPIIAAAANDQSKSYLTNLSAPHSSFGPLTQITQEQLDDIFTVAGPISLETTIPGVQNESRTTLPIQLTAVTSPDGTAKSSVRLTFLAYVDGKASEIQFRDLEFSVANDNTVALISGHPDDIRALNAGDLRTYIYPLSRRDTDILNSDDNIRKLANFLRPTMDQDAQNSAKNIILSAVAPVIYKIIPDFLNKRIVLVPVVPYKFPQELINFSSSQSHSFSRRDLFSVIPALPGLILKLAFPEDNKL